MAEEAALTGGAIAGGALIAGIELLPAELFVGDEAAAMSASSNTGVGAAAAAAGDGVDAVVAKDAPQQACACHKLHVIFDHVSCTVFLLCIILLKAPWLKTIPQVGEWWLLSVETFDVTERVLEE